MGIWTSERFRRGMASDGTAISFFRYLATGNEYGEQYRHFLDGFSDTEYAEPRKRGASVEAGRANPGHSGAQ